jgi:preprotein translocase subunit SecB
MNNSSFQFKGYKIIDSHIKQNHDDIANELKLSFIPKGEIDRTQSSFLLTLETTIEDDNNAFTANIKAKATFSFDKDADPEHIDNFFYINAPAILFPYIRAYISTLTTLSGVKPVTLPTLNLSSLGKDLKDNTTTI